MTKQEALDKIDELRKFVEEEDAKPDYSKWVGRWGFYADSKPECPDDGVMCKLLGYDSTNNFPFNCAGARWKYFRPAKPEEIFPELINAFDFLYRESRMDFPESWSMESIKREAAKIVAALGYLPPF